MKTVFKSFSVEVKAIDIEAGVFEAMISTEAIDRSGDIVRATGAKIENFMRNPVVMWAHDYSLPPVAKAISLEIIAGVGIKSAFQFAPWGANAQADTVRKLWAGGFLNAVSIGFIPTKSEDIKGENANDWFAPQDYLEWELLEYSIVPIPANQEALRMAIKTLAVPEQKRGRILSAANESKLRRASEILQEVLDQVAAEEPQQESQVSPLDSGVTQHSDTEPNIDLTSNDASEEEEIANIILSAWSDKKWTRN
jgi:HK97 family phage prohead protease